ncbi:MAG: hypothetical protein QOE93_2374 [Actinomycetota bacterium]|nr:hypothetical protein [Actinomycetota bacterium]
MLVDVALHGDVFRSDYGGDAGVRRDILEWLAWFLRLHGVLVFADASERDALFHLVEGLPSHQKTIWTDLLSTLPSRSCDAGFRASEATEDDLFRVSDTVGHLIAPRGCLGARRPPGVVLCDAGVPPLVRDLVARSTMRVRRGDDREELWRRVFEPLARNSRKVVVFDPYATKRPSLDGLLWFLAHLAGMGKRVDVEVFTAYRSKLEIACIEERLPSVLARGSGVASLRVRWWARREWVHDRYLRFESMKLNRIVELSSSMDVFSERKDFTLVYRGPGDQYLEVLRDQEVCLSRRKPKHALSR